MTTESDTAEGKAFWDQYPREVGPIRSTGTLPRDPRLCSYLWERIQVDLPNLFAGLAGLRSRIEKDHGPFPDPPVVVRRNNMVHITAEPDSERWKHHQRIYLASREQVSALAAEFNLNADWLAHRLFEFMCEGVQARTAEPSDDLREYEGPAIFGIESAGIALPDVELGTVKGWDPTRQTPKAYIDSVIEAVRARLKEHCADVEVEVARLVAAGKASKKRTPTKHRLHVSWLLAFQVREEDWSAIATREDVEPQTVLEAVNALAELVDIELRPAR